MEINSGMTTQPYTQTKLEKRMSELISEMWDRTDIHKRALVMDEIRKFKECHPTYLDPAIIYEKLLKHDFNFESKVSATQSQHITEMIDDVLEVITNIPQLYNEDILIKILQKRYFISNIWLQKLWRFSSSSNLQRILATIYPDFITEKTIQVIEDAEKNGAEMTRISEGYKELLDITHKVPESFYAAIKVFIENWKADNFKGNVQKIANNLIEDIRYTKTLTEYKELFTDHFKPYALLLSTESFQMKEIGKKVVKNIKDEEDKAFMYITFPELF